jgi:hypothetical protein
LRFTKFQATREAQGRIYKTAPNTLTYSDVRVPKNFRLYFVPIHLLLKSLKACLNLELKEKKRKLFFPYPNKLLSKVKECNFSFATFKNVK